MSKRGKRLLRQGDVLLVPVDELPQDSLAVDEDHAAREHVLAEGEATGHSHVLEGTDVRRVVLHRSQRWAPPLRWTYVVVEHDGAILKHEEHLPIPVEAGVYEVRRQREYQPSRRWVQVVD